MRWPTQLGVLDTLSALLSALLSKWIFNENEAVPDFSETASELLFLWSG